MTDVTGSPSPQPPAAAPVPGKTLGIVALILAFFVQIVGLILGIVALVQSRRAGVKNTPAVWAIVLSSVFMVIASSSPWSSPRPPPGRWPPRAPNSAPASTSWPTAPPSPAADDRTD